MSFGSILFPEAVDPRTGSRAADADAWHDLNLDQFVDALTRGREHYDLAPLFSAPLADLDSVYYRHEVMQDLENAAVLRHVRAFADAMAAMRRQLQQAEQLRNRYQKARWFLDSTATYCRGVAELAGNLDGCQLHSRGLLAFRDYLAAHIGSQAFRQPADEAERLLGELSAIRYTVRLNGDRFTVRRYEDEPDYARQIDEIFARFRQHGAKDHSAEFSKSRDMNHIEEIILEFVARLHPETFSDLERFQEAFAGSIDRTIAAFDREVQFYIGYIEYISPLKQRGLAFSYPVVSLGDKEVRACETYDLPLASTLVADDAPVVVNDLELTGAERIAVVSGPNQGGKTTFARTFGQLHHLASIGLPVPGREARVPLCDRVLTHFEREEDTGRQRGKLEDDVARIRDVLDQATSASVLVLNELFSSTTARDAVALSEKIMRQVVERDLLCVWVTFLDEIVSMSDTAVSMVSTVVPENPAERTFKIERRPSDGLAHAIAIARSYRLTYECLRWRLGVAAQ